MLAIRQILGLAALASIAAAEPVAAQGKLEARYTATLAGIPIGEGSWRIDIGDTQYTAAADGATSMANTAMPFRARYGPQFV